MIDIPSKETKRNQILFVSSHFFNLSLSLSLNLSLSQYIYEERERESERAIFRSIFIQIYTVTFIEACNSKRVEIKPT